MSVVRALARLLLHDYITLGFSANKALNLLKGQGLGYRRTTFLGDYSGLKGLKQSKVNIRNIRKIFMPSDDILAKGTPAYGKKYQFQVRVDYLDTLTGEAKKSYVTLITDNRRRVIDIEYEAMQLVINDVSGELYGAGRTAVDFSAVIESGMTAR